MHIHIYPASRFIGVIIPLAWAKRTVVKVGLIG